MSECGHEIQEGGLGRSVGCTQCGKVWQKSVFAEHLHGTTWAEVVARHEAAQQPAWDDPTGLPYLGGTIGEWEGGIRHLDGEPIAVLAPSIAEGDCRWAVGRNGEGEWAAKGRAGIDAAKQAADRALLREVFRAWKVGLDFNHDELEAPDGRTWTGAQVREILEGAAGANSVPATLEQAGETPAPSITDEQLAEIVTGLPLGGGVIGTWEHGRRGCWDGYFCAMDTGGVWQEETGLSLSLPTAADQDRQLLTWALEEARDDGRLTVYRRDDERDRLVDILSAKLRPGIIVSCVQRKLSDLRAALPDFDWSEVPGYEAPMCAVCATLDGPFESHGPDRYCGDCWATTKPAPSPAAQDPQPFDPWPLTERECAAIVAEVLNEVGDFAEDAAECADDVRTYARWIAIGLHGFDALDTDGHDTWLEANLEDGAETHILCNVDWRWQKALWRWLG